MSEEVALELAEMDKIFESLGEPPTEEPKAEEPPPAEEPKEEEPKEEEPTGEEVPPAKEEVPVETPPAAEEPPPAVDPRDEKISALEAKLAELAAKLDKPAEPPAPTPPAEPEVTEQDFVGETDIEELVQDPKEFNKFMNKIYHKAMIDSRTALASQLPAMVQQQANAIIVAQKMSENFYKTNSDLAKFPKVVQAVSEEIIAASPDITVEELTSRLAVESRKRLNLPTPGTAPAARPAALPKVGKRAGTPASAPKTDTFQNELEDMEKALNS